MVFCGEQSVGENSLEDLIKVIIEDVQWFLGNDICCDCGLLEFIWFLINLGILICIECFGIYREMGVYIFCIQFLELDKLGIFEFLLVKNVGNNSFNDIMEVNLFSFLLKFIFLSDMIV